VYAHILNVIGPDGLRRDLQIWSSGLLPFFEYASTTVRPALLTLLEKHYLPLREDLRPVTRAFILALLPGLEEETNEFFDKVLSILDHLSQSVSSAFFLQNIWLILIGSPKSRLSALNYLSRRLPNLNAEVDPAKIVGRDLGLMMRGLAGALDSDDSAGGASGASASTTLLVRRTALELLVTQLRIDSTTFQHACRQSDRILLVRAALAVVLRRDLSLNRRLYTWLLGPEEGDQVAYLKKHSLDLVRQALRDDFFAPISPGQDRQRPYRIFISLLDKYEIGHALTEVLVLDAFEAVALHASLRSASEELENKSGSVEVGEKSGASSTSSTDDLITTARMLFEAVDPFVMYRQFFLALRAELGGDTLPSHVVGVRPSSGSHPRSSISGASATGSATAQPRPFSAVRLLQYILDTFGVHDEVERLIHLPMLFPVLVELAVAAVAPDTEAKRMPEGLLQDALHLARSLLALIPARVFVRIETIESTPVSDGRPTTSPSLVGRRSVSTTTAATSAALADSAPFFFLRQASSFYGSSAEAGGEQAMAKYVGFQHERIVVRLVDLVAALGLKCVQSEANAGTAAENGSPHGIVSGASTLLFLELARAMLTTLDKSEDKSVTSLFTLQGPADGATLQDGSHQVFQKVDWSGAEAWKALMLRGLRSITAFALVEGIFSLLFTAARCRALKRPIGLDSRDTIDFLGGKLFQLLHPGLSSYHLRAVQLLWELESLSGHAHLQSALTRRITAVDIDERRSGFDVFGTVWKLTDESSPASAMLNLPLTIVLDTLKSSDVQMRQLGETWLRVNLRTYARLLDALLPPIIFPGSIRADLTSSAPTKMPKRRTEALQISKVGPEVKVNRLVYDGPFDQELLNASLATSLAMARFGGQGFTKAIRASSISKSTDSRLSKYALSIGANSYQDLVTDSMITLLRSDFENAYAKTAALPVATTQAHATEIVQAITARGSYDQARLASLETTLVEALLISVQLGTVDRQNKLLHALHSVIHQRSRFSGAESGPRSEFLSRRLPSGPIDTVETVPLETAAPSRTALVPHKLLLPLLKAALPAPSTRPVLSHWADFVLMTVPYYRRSQSLFLLPLQDTLCSLLRASLTSVSGIYSSESGVDTGIETTETDIILFINIAERVLLQCLGEEDVRGETENAEASVGLSEKAGTGSSTERGPDSAGGTGILGLVTNVFSSDSPSSPTTQSAVPSASSRNLQQTIVALHAVWMFAQSSSTTASAAQSTRLPNQSLHLAAAHSNIATKVQARARRGLEKLYSSHSGEVVETLVACWYSARPGLEADRRALATFDILAVLAPSAQIVVSFLCDVISSRTVSAEKVKRSGGVSIASEAVLFQFLETYLARLDGPIAVQVWPVVIVLVKDLLNTATSNRSTIFPCLRCLTAIGEKIALTSALDDRRLRRDLQDTYAKLFDNCVLISGRSFDSSTWIRSRTRDASSEHATDGDGDGDEKLSASVPELSGPALIESINIFLGERGMAALRKFQLDSDRISALCANVVYYIVTPAMRGKGKTLDVDFSVIRLSREMTRLPGTVKTWRSTIGDAFADNRFFTVGSRADAEEWAPLIFSLMNQDKERLVDLISRVNAAPSANIFTNRETEMLGRALNLRRLSYVIFTSTRDHFLTQLPSIQEKVVDVMRTKGAEPVQAEVFLCMRVLLCRFSQQHLAPFWPVLLTELMRLLESLTEELPADNSDQLQLVFAACKFLDLLLTLQTEDFQIHQWLFVTDTVDIMYPPDEWVAESIIDRIATVVNERRPTKSRFKANSPRPGSNSKPEVELEPEVEQPTRPLWQSSSHEIPLVPELAQASGPSHHQGPHRPLRKPLLCDMHELESIDGLSTFFNSLSLAAYEGQYGAVGVDWEGVERGLVGDMFTFSS